MSYIKGGIVTKIEIIKNNNQTTMFLKENFNLSLFTKKSNKYLLNEKILKENFWILKEEYSKLIDQSCDSIKNSDSFIIEKNINNLKKSTIVLTKENEKYYFSKYNQYKFETDIDIKCENLKIFFIPLYWDINKIEAEDFFKTAKFVNNLTRKALENQLKEVCWITVI